MPLYMDVHNMEEGGVTAKDVAEAHQKDLETQGEHGVDYKRYWVDEKAGKIFCLVEGARRRDGTQGPSRSPRARGR
jgi:uncharacterized protein DUF4242